MVHTSRNNYKAKWLASLPSTVQTSTDTLCEAQQSINSVIHTHVNTTIELNNFHSTMMEVARAAKDLVSLMEECQNVGTVDFGSSGHSVDEKLIQMDVKTMARRVRDTIRAAEARIGFLTVIADDLSKTNADLCKEISSLVEPTSALQKAAISTLLIGANPLEAEIEDCQREIQGGTYGRFNIKYENSASEWTETPLTYDTSLYEPAQLTADMKHSRTDSAVSDSGTTDNRVATVNKSRIRKGRGNSSEFEFN